MPEISVGSNPNPISLHATEAFTFPTGGDAYIPEGEKTERRNRRKSEEEKNKIEG